MEVSGRATRLVFEAAEAAGIPRTELVVGLGVGVAHLEDVRSRVDWGTYVQLLDRLSALVDHDPERLRSIGDRLSHAPSYAFLQRFARSVVSQRALFEAGRRWVSPALFPGIVPQMEFLPGNRLRFRGELPSHYVGSEPFLHICAGSLRSLPCLLGLPRATVEGEIRPRSIDIILGLPSSPTIFDRVTSSLRGLGGIREVLDLVEGQRREVDESYLASLRGHQLFRELLENLPAMVAIHRGGRILWVNRVLVQTLGYESADELVGRALLDLVDDSSRDAVGLRMSAAIGAPEHRMMMGRVRRKDGRAIFCEVAPAQEVQFAGGPARLVVGQDVTERVLLQQRLVVSERMASLGLLGAGVAHEVNNPLAYALGNLELAKQTIRKAPEPAIEMLETAIEGLGRVRTIVHDLKTLSRPDDERLEPTDVQAVIESTLALSVTTTSGRARVVRDYREVPLALASAPRLGQVVLNLVLNAIEAMHDGRDNELRLRTFVDEHSRVAFEVEDTGEGIEPQALGRIFDPFFTTKPIGRGTGLGLSICHQIVTALGGEIAVRSEPGRGSIFRVTLPVATTQPAQPSSKPRSTPPSRRARVLIIDDEPRLIDVMCQMLSDHEVAVAPSGSRALELMAEGPFDLVLCDLMMRGMTGMELHEIVAAQSPALADRMVFMTGGAFTERAREFLSRMQERKLSKPFTMSELRAVVRRCVAMD